MIHTTRRKASIWKTREGQEDRRKARKTREDKGRPPQESQKEGQEDKGKVKELKGALPRTDRRKPSNCFESQIKETAVCVSIPCLFIPSVYHVSLIGRHVMQNPRAGSPTELKNSSVQDREPKEEPEGRPGRQGKGKRARGGPPSGC